MSEKFATVAIRGDGIMPAILRQISADSGPDNLTIPIPPLPVGVATAMIVSGA